MSQTCAARARVGERKRGWLARASAEDERARATRATRARAAHLQLDALARQRENLGLEVHAHCRDKLARKLVVGAAAAAGGGAENEERGGLREVRAAPSGDIGSGGGDSGSKARTSA